MLRHGLLKYWWLLFQHSKTIGHRTDIFRNIEDSFALRLAFSVMSPRSVYLDIGSGASSVPSFIYKQWGNPTFATDLEKSWMKEQEKYLKKLNLPSHNFDAVVADATALDFPDCSVDFITAISSVEHIPDDGDARALMEFYRVLKPTGRLVVTVPTSPAYTENQSTFYYDGFERRYDGPTIQSRLCLEGLEITEQLYLISPPREITEAIQDEFKGPLESKNPIDAWYQNRWHDSYPDISILLTIGLIALSTNPADCARSFGACLAFKRR